MRRICFVLALAIPTVARAQATPPAPGPAAPPSVAPTTSTPPPGPVPAPDPATAPAPAPTPAPDVKVAQSEAPADEAAQATATATPPSKPPVEVHGFASIAFSHNFAAPPDRTNSLRTFDTGSDTASIDGVELSVLRSTAKANDLGFRIDAVAGSAIPHVEAAAGLFRDSTGKAGDFDLQQAYGSYKPSDDVTIDLGKFVTPVGYELIEGWDGWNDHYSHSFLFGYAIPFTHTGARAALVMGEVTLTAYLVNGWDNATTTNVGKTGGLNALYVHGPLTAALTYLGGKETDGWRNLVDAVATVKVGDAATVGLNGDFAKGGTDMTAGTWYGGALYGTYAPASKVTLALRGEVFDDHDGVRTGAAQTLEEATATVQVHLNDDAHVRAEIRYDNSDVASFGAMDGPSKHQVTAAVNALAKF